MSSGKLIVKHAYGINTKLKCGLAIIEDHQLAYVCGHQVVVINTESKDQSFIPCTAPQQGIVSLGISAIASSLPKKTIAIAEVSESGALVTFYDSQSLRRRKVLQSSEIGSKEIRCLAFSNDGRFLLTQSAGPEWNLILWNVEKTAKAIGSVKISMSDDTPVHQVSFCPWDNNVIVVIGKGLIRIFKVSEGQLRPVSVNLRREHANYISHTWLFDDKLIIGAESGEIYLLENLEYRAVIFPTGGIADNTDLPHILSLSPISKGFVAGTSEGELWLFTGDEDMKEQFKREDKFLLPKGEGGITSILLTADDSLICTTDTQQLYNFTIGNANTVKEGGSGGFDHVFTPFHQPNLLGDAAIMGIDVALWKPIAVTCGRDKTIRVWNIADRRIEISKTFPEEASSVTVHPSGLYIAIAFSDKIRVASILLDDIFVTKEFNIRSCSEIKFSKGGQYFSAISGANVQIFGTYTGTLVSTLRGHNSKVRTVNWLSLDIRIMTVGQDGTVFIWDTFTGNRSPDSHVGVVPISAGGAFSDGSKVFTTSNEKTLKEIPIQKVTDPNTGQEVAARLPKEITLDRQISTMIVDDTSRILFLATGESELPSAIISILANPTLNNTFDIYPLHSSPITAMCLSKDGSMILSTDSSGCLLVCEIEGIARGAQKPKEGLVSYDFVEEILIRKSDLDARRAKIGDLNAKVEELTLNSEHQLRLKEREHEDKIQEIRQRFSLKLEAENENFSQSVIEKQNNELDCSQQLEMLEEKHKKDLTNVENRYKVKLAIEVSRYGELDVTIQETLKKWNQENKALVESHQAYLQKITEEYEQKLNEEHELQRSLQNEKIKLQSSYEANKTNIEEDADLEIYEMTTKFESRLKQEEETSIALMADHAIMKKNLQMLNKDSEAQKDEIKRMREKEVRLIETIRSLEKDIQSHKKEIREREETITDKEKRIFDLKKKNQELEKFRFVLDYKIKELKLQIAPRENEITTMQRQIEDMDLELEQYHKSNQALTLMIGELKLKLEGLRKELLSQTGRVDINSKLLEKFMRELQELWVARTDHNLLKEKIVILYRTYVQEDVLAKEREQQKEGGEAEGPQKQYNRDREQMERSLDALRRSLKTDAEMHKRDLAKMMRESVLLTGEMNDLRKDYQRLLLQKNGLENILAGGPKNEISKMVEALGLSLAGNAGKASSAKTTTTVTDISAGLGMISVPPTGGYQRSTRSTALRRTSDKPLVFDDNINSKPTTSHTVNHHASKSDLREAWRELEMQSNTIEKLEAKIRAVCDSLNLNPELIFRRIDHVLDGL